MIKRDEERFFLLTSPSMYIHIESIRFGFEAALFQNGQC
jgi:hypothetical protein